MLDIDLPPIDIAVIALYFLIVLVAGFWFRKKASRSMESYFLGNKALPWWMLGLSGAVTNFDIAGTMWLISLLFLFGFKAFWVFWAFAFLIGAFLMSYMGRWIRRTDVMTAVELIRVRFGTGGGGKTARTAAGVMQVIFILFMVGYAFQGIGKFAAAYLPFTPMQCALFIMGVTTVYVVVGGFLSVVFTDVIQAVILNVGGLIVAVLAFIHIDPVVVHAKFSLSLLPPGRIPEMAGSAEYADYEMFGLLTVIWVMTGLLVSMGMAGGGYGEQRFLAVRNATDAAKAGAGWSLFLVVRWAMVAGIVFLAFSNQAGVDDPEQVFPLILRDYMPAGIRGFILAGLIAAFMSTFSSTLNAGASIVVRDLIQPVMRNSGEKSLIRLSYAATVGIVAAGLFIGTQAESINDIWIWILTGLNACYIIPNAFRWYWWRMNGWGYASGVFSGLLLSLTVLIWPETPQYVYSPVIHGAALAGCIMGTLLTRPVDRETLLEFYRRIRPKGFWKPVRSESGLSAEESDKGLDRPLLIVVNVLLGMAAIFCADLLPFYVIGHWFREGLVCLIVFAAACTALYFTWYRPLKAEERE